MAPGSVVAGPASYLDLLQTNQESLRNSLRIDGNLIGDHAARLLLDGGILDVSGNVIIDGVEAVFLNLPRVGKNIHVEGATAHVNVDGGHVAGSIEVIDNTLPTLPGYDPPRIQSNTVGKNLICYGNTPTPIVSSNVVTRAALGQCAP